MATVWVPLDFTALPTEQQDKMFVAWCGLVFARLKEQGAHGLLKFQPKGASGPAQMNIQGADVWIEANGVKYKTNLLIAFNDFLDNSCPIQGNPVRRNDPVWYASSLVNRAKDWEIFPPGEGYGILPRPTNPDIAV